MREWSWKCLLWLVFMGTSIMLIGQTQPQAQGLNLRFQRQNNFTYRTELSFRHLYEKDKYKLELYTAHENLLNSGRSGNPFVQLQFRHQFWQHYAFSKQWSVSAWTEIDQFFSSGNQRYSQYLGTTYQPSEGLKIQPLVGYTWDYRSMRLDQGASPALWIGWLKDWEDGVYSETRLFARYKDLSPRRQINLSFQSTVAKEFEEGAEIAFTAIAGSNEMNDYRAESVERIRSDTAGAILSWSYQLYPGVVWQSNNRIMQNQRIFDYQKISPGTPEFNDLRFSQFDAATSQRVSADFKKVRGYFLYEFLSLNRRYRVENSQELTDREFERVEEREEQKDYFRNQTKLEFVLNYQATDRHRIDLIGTNRYLKYDTPGENNFDDHDELNYGLSLAARSTWSRNFQTTYRLLGSVRRYAFLFKERSQDNYTQRNLRMEFGYVWTPIDRLRIEGQQYLYVTYNVKDFDDRNLTDRSTRNLESKLRFAYRVNRKSDVDGELYRRQVHVSYLNWEKFAETTLDTTTQFIGRAEWHYRPASKKDNSQSRYQIDLGVKHVAQLRYQNTSMTSLENILTPINLHINSHQTGPLTGGSWQHKSGASVSLSVWWQLQILSYEFFEIESLTTLNSTYRESELIKPVINFRPFIRLQAQVMLKG